MTFQSLIELDVFRCTLDSVSQIEASAGTDKTWNICALYIRLLLEKDFSAENILVVTLTKKSAYELCKRIREILLQLVYALKTKDTSNIFIKYLFDTILDSTSRINLDRVMNRIHHTLYIFNQAPIYTIHTFFHRVLQNAPFSCGLPFSFDLVDDDIALRLEIASNFWHRRVETVANQDTRFAKWLVKFGAGPSILDKYLMCWIKKSLSIHPTPRWDEIATQNNSQKEIVTGCFTALSKIWSIERNTIEKILLKTMQPMLNQRSHNIEAISDALAAWSSYFEPSNVEIKNLSKAALKLTRTALVKATKKGGITPEHPFFNLAESLEVALINIEDTQRKRWLTLVSIWLNEAPRILTLRKRMQGFLTFDDLPIYLYDALKKQPSLIDILRKRYCAALIDEFQDIDSLQFSIFDKIFIQSGGPLFLIGDPKQAIYSFRGADLSTYLEGYTNINDYYKLSVNYRSIPTIVKAYNRFFGANTRAFVFDRLNYYPMYASCCKHRQLIDETDDTLHTGDFRIWMLPNNNKVLSKSDSQWYAAQACAVEIKRLIQGARDDRVRLGQVRLLPKDIAVLVQTHRQGRLVKKALTILKINSTEFTKVSVFLTIDAHNFERVLSAIKTPNDLLCLRTALSIDWFNLNAEDLYWMNQSNGMEHNMLSSCKPLSSNTISVWIERFSHYQLLWKQHGFSAMWHRFLSELKITEQLMNLGIDGERRVTDINHLAELIQIYFSSHPSISSTLCWFAAQRLDGGSKDAQLRLASDYNLVQIITIYKSKGLEYPIIFCPFLNDGMLHKHSSAPSISKVLEFHNNTSSSVLKYINSQDVAEGTSRKAIREQGAERIRLIYVALTRAIYRCYIVAGPYLSLRSTRESRRSMMNWLVAGNEQTFDDWLNNPPDDSTLAKAWRALSGGPISIGPLPTVINRQECIQTSEPSRILFAERASRALINEWKIESFSSLTASAVHHEINIPSLIDREFRINYDISMDITKLSKDSLFERETSSYQEPITLPNDDILMFPSSVTAGKCLHRMFELSDFSDASSWPHAASNALHDYPVKVSPELIEYLPSMMVKLVNDVVHTELVPGFRMADLSRDRRLNEIGFLFPVRSLDITSLRLLINEYGYSDIKLSPDLLSGFLKGFIDMIVKNDNRFWIIDWKSKHLGYTPDAYSERALDTAMADHAYHLQALIYIVALHKYLRNRLHNYDYDVHIAGYIYLFVRGVRPNWKSGNKLSGIYTHRPTRALVDKLDRIMNG
ncbi:MAG: exodeoxyribonuclease V subunit beta [Burkholderia sp.]|nr:exodeoxyribonuclease V subunit beta [Burkholderia sp.]